MIWTCHRCGIRVPIKSDEFPVHCCCGFTETYEEAVNRSVSKEPNHSGLKEAPNHRCQYLGGVQHSFNGRWLSCGCSRIYLYPCQHFSELVTLNTVRRPNKIDTADDVKQGIKDFHPEYKGRTCQECAAFAAIAPPEPPTPKHSTTFDRFDAEKHLASVPYHAVSHRIAAVTCHFNPQRSQSRIRCYQTFAKQFPKIGMALYPIEGSLDDRWEIPDAWQYAMDPDSHLFAKENLLNLAIQRLPDRYTHVLWIDSDVLLLNHDYTDRLQDACQRHPVVQGFRELRYLGPNGEPQTQWRQSLGYYNTLKGMRTASPQEAYPGLAWAASREILTAVGGLYDRAITGGGDVAWATAVFGDQRVPYTKHWSPSLVDDVLRYGQQVWPLVKSVGYVDARGVHLYHGQLEARQYVRRNSILGKVQFDPQQHLEYSFNGTLRWTPAAPGALRQAVRDYIHGRKEDE